MESDTMTTFTIDKYEQQEGQNLAKDTEADMKEKQVEKKDAPPVDAKNQSVVTLYGPLSSVYAEALQQVFKRSSVVSTEASQQQMATIMALHDESEEQHQPDTVVYVADDQDVNKDAAVQFDELRLALDNKKAAKIVVLESRAISNKMALFENYAVSQGSKVFFDRNKFLSHMKQRYA